LRKLRMPKLFAEPLAVTVSALALTLPIMLLRLPGGTSWLTFPANMLLTPLVGPAMILSGLSVFLPFGPLIWLATRLADFIFWATHFLASLPGPRLQGDLTSLAIPLFICAAIAAAALILRYYRKPVALRYTALAVTILLMLGAWLPGFLVRNRIYVTRLDTGEGYAYFISQGNRAALIGAGGDSLPAAAATGALSSVGARELELLLIPGTSNALASAASQIRRDIPVRQLIHAAETPHGYTRFALWDDLTGVLFLSESAVAVLLEWSGEVLTFGGESPWR
jgi:hypothetical protein